LWKSAAIISAMNLREWERDVINRQRNIVFPDTMLNETRLFRNIVQGKTELTMVHRAGILVLATVAFWGGCFGIAGIIASALPEPGILHVTLIAPALFCIIFIALGIKLAIRVVFPQSALVKKKMAHRPSRRP
jgi:hypothetical protein